jgi:hypothetical protein
MFKLLRCASAVLFFVLVSVTERPVLGGDWCALFLGSCYPQYWDNDPLSVQAEFCIESCSVWEGNGCCEQLCAQSGGVQAEYCNEGVQYYFMGCMCNE